MTEGKRNIIGILCAVIAVTSMFIVGVAGNASAGVVKLSAAQFTSDGGGGSYYKLFSAGTITGDDTGPCLVAPVSIPGTATSITSVVVYLTDDGSSAAGSPWFRLTGLNMTTGVTKTYVVGDVTTGTTTLQGITVPFSNGKPSNATVPGMVYQFGTCLYGGQALYGAKISYLP